MIRDDKNKKIRDFLQGKLKGKELEGFYKEIDDNKELLEDLSVDIVKDYGRIRFKDKLEMIHQEVYGKQKTHINLYLKIAASIIIVLGFSFLIYFSLYRESDVGKEIVSVDSTAIKEKVKIAEDETSKKVNDKTTPLPDKPKEYIAKIPTKQTKSNQEIFAKYFTPHPVHMCRGDEEQLDEAFILYEQKRYQEASVLFNEALKTLDNNKQINEAVFYRGICILSIDSTETQLENARQLINTVYIDENSKLKEEAGWYLALIYIKGDERNKAKEILTKIVSEKSYNYRQAILLLKEL